jgi:hypothetical protein
MATRRISRGYGGRGVALTTDHHPPLSAEVKETVDLYLYFPSGPSCSVLGRALLFTGSSTPTL